MHKLNIEIHPYASKGLSPRYNISIGKFKKIRSIKVDKTNASCEACGGKDVKMELHEAGIYKNKCYIFKGFYLLCQRCHDMVHFINLSTNRVGVTKGEINYMWSRAYPVKKYSKFKTKSQLAKHIHRSFKETFNFIMADRVKCDYSIAKKYGLDPMSLKKRFDDNYNHFSCRIRFMSLYLRLFFIKIEIGNDNNPLFYDQYQYPKMTKYYESILYAEYLKHKEFYDSNKTVIYGSASKERDKVILKYAEIMRKSLM